MKAVLSSTYDDLYLFNLPIVTWAWNKLGVEVELFLPNYNRAVDPRKTELATMFNRIKNIHFFNCPPEKEATYAQVSRLFACCLNLPEDEVLITSDADMMVFKKPPVDLNGLITIFGYDLVPENQYPMCYASGSVKEWQDTFRTKLYTTYQQQLDYYLGNENCENMRGNLWSRDQELLFNFTSQMHRVEVPRARPGTQFAENRLDRDDAYILDRLSPDIVDYHMHRPLWEEANFQKLMTIMKYFWPTEDFTWIETYRQEYIKLL